LNLTDCGGVPVYTLENQEYFGTREVYFNDLERFFFFSRAAFEILPQMDWQPRVVHCHDWLTALAVMWIKKAGYPYATVFTIHNLTYQGFFDENFMRHHDLKKDWDYSPPGAPRPPRCFISQAILWADMVTAVSETYAREITTPELGVGQDALLRYRGASLVGILNGLDTDYWDPQADPFLPVNFGPGETPKRTLNKIALQKVWGLPVGGDIPLIGMVQRLDEQKGLDILLQGSDRLLSETGAQFVILGEGWDNYEDILRQLASRYPRQVASYIAFEIELAHLIYGGCDMFLMPSRFEPCGLGQMIAMRYGALPVVRHTGGLVDTVPPLSPDFKTGRGFVFHEYSPAALVAAVKEAVEAFRNKGAWTEAVRRVSQTDFSWQTSARKYEQVYKQVTER
ncbi:MAG: glycogen/starch synthase, partial [Dehalococcoidales bacterium]|nr:glycogen/starch synthase [Dehalococcoidales bacterium]